MVKGQTTLYLEKSLVEQAKELGLNISEISNIALDVVTRAQSISKKSLMYRFQRYTLQLAEADLAAHELQAQKLKQMLDLSVEEFNQSRVQYIEAMKASTIANMMRSINNVVITNEYDSDKSWKDVEQLVSQLANLGYEIDKEWFDNHCKRLERWT